jgi:hypothetical protein
MTPAINWRRVFTTFSLYSWQMNSFLAAYGTEIPPFVRSVDLEILFDIHQIGIFKKLVYSYLLIFWTLKYELWIEFTYWFYFFQMRMNINILFPNVSQYGVAYRLFVTGLESKCQYLLPDNWQVVCVEVPNALSRTC